RGNWSSSKSEVSERPTCFDLYQLRAKPELSELEVSRPDNFLVECVGALLHLRRLSNPAGTGQRRAAAKSATRQVRNLGHCYHHGLQRRAGSGGEARKHPGA